MGKRLVEIFFVIVIISVAAQGTAVPAAARLLGLRDDRQPGERSVEDAR